MRRIFLLMLLLLLCGGCGGKKTIQVTGRVLFEDGTPLTNGVITFTPVENPDTVPGADGIIQSNGTFQLRTYGSSDGALAGQYRVAIRVSPPPGAPEGSPPLIDPKFALSNTSNLEAHVQAGEKNEFTFTVHPPRPRQ